MNVLNDKCGRNGRAGKSCQSTEFIGRSSALSCGPDVQGRLTSTGCNLGGSLLKSSLLACFSCAAYSLGGWNLELISAESVNTFTRWEKLIAGCFSLPGCASLKMQHYLSWEMN